MKNLAIFCSGFGSNLQAVINAVKKGSIAANIALVISDKVDAFALVRAQKAKIPFLYVDPAGFRNKQEYDEFIVKNLRKRKIDFVVLAGFIRVIGPYFVKSFKNKIINIHPALLPCFKGTSGIKDAFEYGVKVTGVTVHFVDNELDGGPIILQQAICVKDNGTLESLSRSIHKLEHKILPLAIKLLIEGKLRIKGRKVSKLK